MKGSPQDSTVSVLFFSTRATIEGAQHLFFLRFPQFFFFFDACYDRGCTAPFFSEVSSIFGSSRLLPPPNKTGLGERKKLLHDPG